MLVDCSSTPISQNLLQKKRKKINFFFFLDIATNNDLRTYNYVLRIRRNPFFSTHTQPHNPSQSFLQNALSTSLQRPPPSPPHHPASSPPPLFSPSPLILRDLPTSSALPSLHPQPSHPPPQSPNLLRSLAAPHAHHLHHICHICPPLHRRLHYRHTHL